MFKRGYCRSSFGRYVHSTAVIIGKVELGKNIFIAPGAVIRADEPGSSIKIKDNCNIQDRVIIHALENTSVLVEENVSLAHGSIIHGPCKIGKGSFIGFNSVVFKSDIAEKSLIKHLVVVENINIFSRKKVESGQLVNSENDIKNLDDIDEEDEKFMAKVVEVNLNLIKEYKKRRK